MKLVTILTMFSNKFKKQQKLKPSFGIFLPYFGISKAFIVGDGIGKDVSAAYASPRTLQELHKKDFGLEN